MHTGSPLRHLVYASGILFLVISLGTVGYVLIERWSAFDGLYMTVMLRTFEIAAIVTSGCLVLGRHRKALAHLGLLFKHGKVGKTYWAVVEGGPDAVIRF